MQYFLYVNKSNTDSPELRSPNVPSWTEIHRDLVRHFLFAAHVGLWLYIRATGSYCRCVMVVVDTYENRFVLVVDVSVIKSLTTWFRSVGSVFESVRMVDSQQ